MIRNDFTANVKIENGFPVVVNSSVAAKATVDRAKTFGVNYILLTDYSIIRFAVQILYLVLHLIARIILNTLAFRWFIF